MTPAEINGIEEKVDDLIAIAGRVRHALTIRDIFLGAGAALVVAVLLWGGVQVSETQRIAKNAENIAKVAYRQSLTNNRDVLQGRRDFAQTRDCPVVYLKDLLKVASERGDLNSVKPPCDPEDIAAIDNKIAAVDAKIKAAGG